MLQHAPPSFIPLLIPGYFLRIDHCTALLWPPILDISSRHITPCSMVFQYHHKSCLPNLLPFQSRLPSRVHIQRNLAPNYQTPVFDYPLRLQNLKPTATLPIRLQIQEEAVLLPNPNQNLVTHFLHLLIHPKIS